MTRPDEKRLLGPGFPGDDGSAAPAVHKALEAHRDGRGSYADALGALLEARVLVPVVAVLGDVEYDAQGLAHDKTSDMATVLMTGADGRKALLVFTSMATLQGWRPDARPVPVTFRDAARAAVQEQADAIVLDVAGPVVFAVEGDDLRAAAAGYALGWVGDRSAWVAPEGA
ncbi:SseB family protein [Nocardioides sp. DS6]|uniref:SseB family protein n=1 Tax=Nocardioides eburneus TaxID=3231482 RepID=A0ABV3T1Z2_9ACTN